MDRCDADPTDLDSPDAVLRTREQTATLLKDKDSDSLWYDHGIVPDFWVRYRVADIFGTNLINIQQPFTMQFPRADIHELLTPDLLHQAIKGTFKDHLVQWIEDYLTLMHGPSKAESILDEIDRRYVKSYVRWNTL